MRSISQSEDVLAQKPEIQSIGWYDGEHEQQEENEVSPLHVSNCFVVCKFSPPVAFAITILRPGACSLRLVCFRHLGGLMGFSPSGAQMRPGGTT